MKNIFVKRVLFLFFIATSLFLSVPAHSSEAFDEDLLEIPTSSDLSASREWEETTMYVQNFSFSEVSVAFCYRDHNAGAWVVKGWLIVPPGHRRSATFITDTSTLYYYARSNDMEWNDDNGEFMQVINEDFIYEPENANCPEGTNSRYVGFIMLEVTDYTFTIELRE